MGVRVIDLSLLLRHDGTRWCPAQGGKRPEPCQPARRPVAESMPVEPDPSSRRAACSCGALTVTVLGEPVRVSICHCLACQRRTGSVFGAQARFRREQATLEGAAAEYVRVGDSGGKITFHFCPSCGSTVYYELDAIPGFIAVPVGAFADPAFPPPRIAVYGSRAHPWVRIAHAEDMELLG